METGRAARGNEFPVALWGAGLVLVLLLRVAGQALPSMYLWGVNFGRQGAGWLAWGALAIMFASCLPPLGRAVQSALEPGGIPDPTRDRFVAWVAICLALAGLLLLPDRGLFMGDAMLRRGVLNVPGTFWRMFPQAMPLDGLLHERLVRVFGRFGPDGPWFGIRALGLLEGVTLVAVAFHFAVASGLRGARAAGLACALAFGGYLAQFTGYGKPTGEIALCTLAAGVYGIDVVRERRGTLVFGVAIAAALLLHRSALPLLVLWLVVAVAWLRDPRTGRSLAGAIPLLLPPLALALLGPRMAGVLLDFDLQQNVLSADVVTHGGVLRAAFTPLRLLDDLNVLLVHAPLLPVALAIAVGLRSDDWRDRGGLPVLALVVGFAPLLVLVDIAQGPFRDWDDYAGAGAAASLACAWVLGRALARTPRGWLAVPVGVVPLLAWIVLMAASSQPGSGLARARAFLDEPPARPRNQRLSTLDYAGLMAIGDWRWAAAEDAYAALAQEAPRTRVLLLWGTSAMLADHPQAAHVAFSALVDREPEEPAGWFGLWMAALNVGDGADEARAATVMRQWPHDGPQRRVIAEYLQHYPLLREHLPRGGLDPQGR